MEGVSRSPARDDPRARRSLREALAVYADPRMAAILGMGFASGLPLLLTTATLSYWLKKVGVDKTTIGLFALVGLPYSLKFLWAPALDHLRVPVLGPLLGRRRAWALVTQAALALSILGLGRTDPAATPLVTAAWALAVAFFSASQDVAIDAYRIEILREHEQGAGAAVTQTGYRFGLLAAGAGAIALSDYVPWPTVFACLAALMGIGMLIVLLSPAPPGDARAEVRGGSPAAPVDAGGLASALQRGFVEPLGDLMTRPQWVTILVFALLYKFGDAISGVMANPFFVEIGFSGAEIASVTKVFGMLATLAGVFVGGAIVAQLGILRALLWGGILQAATNLLYSLQAQVGHDLALLAVVVGADNFTGGVASAAFVAYLSSLCRLQFTGTQYALLTSLMAFGRTVLSSGGGWLADQLEWAVFFAVTALLAAPGLVLLTRLREAQQTRPSP